MSTEIPTSDELLEVGFTPEQANVLLVLALALSAQTHDLGAALLRGLKEKHG